MQYIQDVQQPLLNFLNDTTQSKIKAILKGEIEMESILTCYYDQNKTAQ